MVLPPVGELFGGPVGVERHPSAHRGRPARPPRDRHRPRRDRRLPHRPAGAGHRRRRLDRLRAVPADRRGSSRPSSSCSTATSRRCTPCSCRSRAGRCSTAATSCVCDIRDRSRLASVFAEHRAARSSSTPPRSSTCRCCEMHPARRSRPTSGAPRTCSTRAAASGSSGSSTSRPTRPPTRAACSATPSASPSG